MIGAKILGPRIGKYDKNGKPQAIPGHNLPIGALGVFILWFCWFGFNCGSTTAATSNVGDIAITTNLAAAAATLVTLAITWVRYGKPDVSMTLNGSLAGLVGITAGCDCVSYWGSIVIGAICGVAVVFVIEFVDRVLKIDDPVGATGVHWACGIIGTILTGLFDVDKGLFYGGGANPLLAQLFGAAVVGCWALCMGFLIFKGLDLAHGLRVPSRVEEEGLDIYEHGETAYNN